MTELINQLDGEVIVESFADYGIFYRDFKVLLISIRMLQRKVRVKPRVTYSFLETLSEMQNVRFIRKVRICYSVKPSQTNGKILIR